MGVCCWYAPSMVIPRLRRDCSYSRGRDFNSLAISLASLPGKTGKTIAARDIVEPPAGTFAKGHWTASPLGASARTGRCLVSPRPEDDRDKNRFCLTGSRGLRRESHLGGSASV